jgi:glycosyltransferase involved in cell wall biosynthesis
LVRINARKGARDVDALAYSGYAERFFRWSAANCPDRDRRLFVFHPEPTTVRRILVEDAKNHPECSLSHRKELEVLDYERLARRSESELADSTHVIVASSFSGESVRNVGFTGPLSIVPYGTNTPVLEPKPQTRGRLRSEPTMFAFIGQGVQRKGLHHLLKAWRSAALSNAQLVVVGTNLDPGIARLAGDNVTMLGRQEPERLEQVFAATDIFVLPSLVEGFGHVLLEALARGCYTISTSNTGLPDLRLPDTMAMTLTPGDVGQLAGALAEARERHADGTIDRAKIASRGQAWTWQRFRRGIVATV